MTEDKVTPLKMELNFAGAFGLYAMILRDGTHDGKERARKNLVAEGRMFDNVNEALKGLEASLEGAAGNAVELEHAIRNFLTNVQAALVLRAKEQDHA